MKNFGLIPRLIVAIIAGILTGIYLPESLANVLYTFTEVFGEILNYVVPLIILAFIIPGISELGAKAGRLLGKTALTAYISTIVAGIAAFLVASNVIPLIAPAAEQVAEAQGLSPYLELEIPPIMGIMTALVTSFIFGIGINYLKNEEEKLTLYNFMQEVRTIVEFFINKVIIPFLPIHIAGIFADMAAEGTVFRTITMFGPLFVLVIAMHITYLLVLYSVANRVSPENKVLTSIKKMLPAYTTALGTISSAATIPVTLKSAKTLKVKEKIVDFVVPLGATIHLAGSTIALVSCAVATMVLYGEAFSLASFLPFIFMLALIMIGAPGVPGGAVMAALAPLASILGFTESMQGLMIALYMAQDAFGTACNVTGDGAISIIVDYFHSDSEEEEVSTERARSGAAGN